jgi:hypothetical protein
LVISVGTSFLLLPAHLKIGDVHGSGTSVDADEILIQFLLRANRLRD